MARRREQPIKEPRKRLSGRYDDEAGVWLVPVADAWLDLLSADWSPPVQLKAVIDDGGDTYTIRVRPAATR